MLRIYRTFLGAFLVQWRTTLNLADLAFPVIGQLSTVLTVGWIVSETGSSAVITAAAFGCFMTALWRASAFQGGWILSQTHDAGALEIEMTTGSSLAVIIIGRLMAIVTLYGVVASLTATLVLLLGRTFDVGSLPLLLISIPFAGLSIVACAYILIPISFLTGGMPGFFNAILPGIVIISGFLQPTDILPPFVKSIGIFFGTTWAMDAIRRSIQHGSDSRAILSSLALSLLLSVLFIIVSKRFIDIAERRLRQGRYASFNAR
jgi:ABC-type multidrug transport system permease subunit